MTRMLLVDIKKILSKNIKVDRFRKWLIFDKGFIHVGRANTDIDMYLATYEYDIYSN